MRASRLIIIAVILTYVQAGAADWPGWRGAARNGISSETDLNWHWPPEGPKVLWKGSVGTGFSCVTLAAGRAYTLGNRENVDTVFCLDAETGSELWRHSYPCRLDPKAYEGGPMATPAVDGDRVYTISKFGHCLCLNAQTGAVIWSAQLEPPPWTEEDYKVWWGEDLPEHVHSLEGRIVRLRRQAVAMHRLADGRGPLDGSQAGSGLAHPGRG